MFNKENQMKTNNDEVEIRAMLKAWAQAIRAKDAKGVAAHFAETEVRFSLAPPLQIKTPLERDQEEWFATWDGPVGFEVRDLCITAGENIAFCHCFVRISGQKVDGAQPSVWARETLGLRKIDGCWKIAHEHGSVPFYMDGSNKAAVDLQP